MAHKKTIILVLFLIITSFAFAQKSVYKFRTTASFFSDSTDRHETPVWKSFPEGTGTLVVYDGNRKKLNTYGKTPQDLSIIYQKYINGVGESPDLESISCVDQENNKVEITMIFNKITKQTPYPKRFMVVDYGPIKFKFELDIE